MTCHTLNMTKHVLTIARQFIFQTPNFLLPPLVFGVSSGGRGLFGARRFPPLYWDCCCERGATTAAWPRCSPDPWPRHPMVGERRGASNLAATQACLKNKRGKTSSGVCLLIRFFHLSMQCLVCAPPHPSFILIHSLWVYIEEPLSTFSSTHLLRFCSTGRGSATCCPARWWSRPPTGWTLSCCPTGPSPPSSSRRGTRGPWLAECHWRGFWQRLL